MPQISVIVPVFKVEKYIHRCVDSILNQTFTDFELILVDDGSPDNCGVICDEYAAKDSRVVVIHQENGGLSAARNAGIDWSFANSDSQWLSFIDSDDWVHREYLERLYTVAIDNNVSVSVCAYTEVKDFCTPTDMPSDKAQCIKSETFWVEYATHATIAWGKLYKKECFKSIRYPVGKIHEDEFVTYRILFAEKEIAFLDNLLYFYFSNEAGITKSPWIPKRLDSIEAISEQICYMKKNRFMDGYRYAVKKYILFLGYHLNNLKECDGAVQNKYAPMLTAKLKKSLIKNTKIVPIKNNEWIYEFAFPQMMWLYWVGKSKISKIKGN